jgi:hypothetical protein
MSDSESDLLRAQRDEAVAGVREVTHDLSNRVGILRMAVYYLQSTDPDQERRSQYYTMMNDTLDKTELTLRRLRSLFGLGPVGELTPPASGERTP